MDKIRILGLLLGLGLLFAAQAQYVEGDRPASSPAPAPARPARSETAQGSGFSTDRLVLGGNGGLSFGNQTTYIELSPLVGYRLTEDLMTGLGASYIYYSYRFLGQSVATSIYGGRTFLRYQIVPQAFAHTELEALNWEYQSLADPTLRRIWQYNPLVGGGYQVGLGTRSFAQLMVLYNLNHDSQRSFYGSPWIIRVGFVGGLGTR